MFGSVKRSIKSGARKAALSTVASLLLCVGLAFLTAAAWFALATVLETMMVAATLGGAYLGIGLIVLAVALRSSDNHHDSEGHAPGPQQTEAIIQSFLTGMATGQGVAARR